MMHEDELPYLADDIVLKLRKPYTIKKQRERWTKEEHQKFLDALRLYGRAWRHIEEHIGTKTAIQIRSHAQKFFCKVEREQSGGVTSTNMILDIDIPPPRPKRKPNRPYPRKAGGSCFSSPADVESVKFATPPFGEEHSVPAAIAPFSTPSKRELDYGVSETVAVTRPQPRKVPPSLKLFGQNVDVPTVHNSKDPATALSLTRPPIPSSDIVSANSEETRFLPKQCGTKDEDATVVEVNFEKSYCSSLQDVAKLGSRHKSIPGKNLGDLQNGSIWKTVNSGVDMSCLDSSVLIKQDQENERELDNDGQDQSLTSSSALTGSHQMKSRLAFHSHEAAGSIDKPSDWKVDGTSTNKLFSDACMQISNGLYASSKNFPFTSTEYPPLRPDQPAALQEINSEVLYYSPGNLFGWQWIPTLASYNSETLAARVMTQVFPIAVLGSPPLRSEPDMSAAAAAAASAWFASQGISVLNTSNLNLDPFSSPVKRELGGQQLPLHTVQVENSSKDIVEETQSKVLTAYKKLDNQASSKASLFRLTDLTQSAEPDLIKSSCNGYHSEDNCEHISCHTKPGKQQQDVDLQYYRENDQKRARKGSTESCSTFISEDISSCLGTRDGGDNLRCLVRSDETNDCARCDGNTSGDGGPSSNSSVCGNPSKNLNDGMFFDNAEDSEYLTWRADGDLQSNSSELQETYRGERHLRGKTDSLIEHRFTKHHGGAVLEAEMRKEVSDEGRMVFPPPQDFSKSSTSQEAGDSSSLCLQVRDQLLNSSVPTNSHPFTNKAEGCIQRLISKSCKLATSSPCRIAIDWHDRQEDVSPASCSAFQDWHSSSLKSCEVTPSEQPQKFKGMMEPALSDNIDSSLELQEGKLYMLKAVRTSSRGGNSGFKGVGFVPYQRHSVASRILSDESKDFRPS